jgi:hypothetical protein
VCRSGQGRTPLYDSSGLGGSSFLFFVLRPEETRMGLDQMSTDRLRHHLFCWPHGECILDTGPGLGSSPPNSRGPSPQSSAPASMRARLLPISSDKRDQIKLNHLNTRAECVVSSLLTNGGAPHIRVLKGVTCRLRLTPTAAGHRITSTCLVDDRK